MPVFRTAAVALLVAVAIPAVSTSVRAQDNSIAGRVVSAGSNEPLPAAQISVVGSSLRVNSDDQGRFRLTGLSGTSVRLDVRRIGYRGVEVTARIGQTDVLVQLLSNPQSLEAVVVTGTAAAQAKREIGNAVATINASDVVATAPILSMQGLINGRAPSVVVMPTSGMVGSDSRCECAAVPAFRSATIRSCTSTAFA